METEGGVHTRRAPAGRGQKRACCGPGALRQKFGECCYRPSYTESVESRAHPHRPRIVRGCDVARHRLAGRVRIKASGSLACFDHVGFPDGDQGGFGRPFVQSAFSPRSSLRIRMASSTRDRNILPSPIFPVLAVFKIVSTTMFTSLSGSTISNLSFGSKSTVYSRPRYTSVCPFCRPWPRTSVTVIPSMPTSRSASLTDSNREG